MPNSEFMSRIALIVWLVLFGLLTLLIAAEAPIDSFRRTIGPPIVFAPPDVQSTPDPKGRLIVVNWNVHVGHGNVVELIEDISRTEEASGFGKPQFVLLLHRGFGPAIGMVVVLRTFDA
jgi:hypothetical protein